jgi:hypothetical protein
VKVGDDKNDNLPIEETYTFGYDLCAGVSLVNTLLPYQNKLPTNQNNCRIFCGVYIWWSNKVYHSRLILYFEIFLCDTICEQLVVI